MNQEKIVSSGPTKWSFPAFARLRPLSIGARHATTGTSIICAPGAAKRA
jgi:hypothetical protein